MIVQNVASDLQRSGNPMTVYVTGDIHGGVDMQKLRDWELGDSLTGDDYLIVAGDFGFPWDFSAEECADIAWLESRP